MFRTVFRTYLSTVTIITLLLCSQGALAHAHLTSQYPAADDNMDTSPQTLTLTFSENIEPAFSGVELTRSDDTLVALGKIQLNSGGGNQLIVSVEPSLPSGRYHISWHVLSTDGHKTQGDYYFKIR